MACLGGMVEATPWGLGNFVKGSRRHGGPVSVKCCGSCLEQAVACPEEVVRVVKGLLMYQELIPTPLSV